RCVASHPWPTDSMKSLRSAGIEPFRNLHDPDYRFQELSLAELPHSAEQVSKQVLDRDGIDLGRNIAWVAPEPRLVYGLQIRRKGELPRGKQPQGPCLQVFWKKKSQAKFAREKHYLHYWKPHELVHTIWLFDMVDE